MAESNYFQEASAFIKTDWAEQQQLGHNKATTLPDHYKKHSEIF